MNRLPMLLVAALCALAAVTPAAAQAQQPPCMPLPEFLKVLADEYGEQPVRRGYISPALAALVTVNAETGTWTILRVTPQGMACGMAAGEMWQEIEPKPAGREG